MIIIPREIINIILFEYLDDIDVRINFGFIKKLDRNNFNFLNKIISDNIYSFSLFHRKNKTFFSYRYIKIKDSKFYRLTYEYEEDSNYIWLKTEICNDRIPMYNSLINNSII